MIWVNTSHLLKQAGKGWFPPHSRPWAVGADGCWVGRAGRGPFGGVTRGAGCHWPQAGQLPAAYLSPTGQELGGLACDTSQETLAIEESTSWADCYPFSFTANSCGGISMSASAGREWPLSARSSVWTWQIKCASCAWWYCYVLLPWAPLDAALTCLMTREELLG